MKIFLTGGTGFIGSHFINQAHAHGIEILAQRRSSESRPRIHLEREPVWLDTSLDQIETTHIVGCDAFVHLAAVGVSPQRATWDKCFSVNTLISLNILRMAYSAGIRNSVLAGSYAEYGLSGLRLDPIPPSAPLEPTEVYAASKASFFVGAAAFARSMNVPLTYFRVFSAFGEGQYPTNFWPSLRKAALAGEDFPMSPGEQVRDFIPVEQVAKAFIDALGAPLTPGQPHIANIGSGEPQTLRAFAEHWWKEWGAKGKLLPGALPYRENEVMRYVPEISEIFKP